jgi:hypothetical protein
MSTSVERIEPSASVISGKLPQVLLMYFDVIVKAWRLAAAVSRSAQGKMLVIDNDVDALTLISGPITIHAKVW